MKKALLGFLCVLQMMGYAQKMEEDTKVLSKIQGEPLFMLNANEYVYSYEPDGGWYKIRLEVFVSPEEVVDDEVIVTGTSLLNKEGEEIGKALTEVKIVEGKAEKVYRGKSKYRAILEGYVYKTKFADGSRPEDRVSELLAIKSRTEQMEGYKELFKEYGFEERKFDDLTAYAYLEQGKTLSEDKDFRMIIVFRGEETVYAILTNDQTVTAPKVKLTWEDGSFKAIYMYKPTTAQAEAIQDEIMYTFIAL